MGLGKDHFLPLISFLLKEKIDIKVLHIFSSDSIERIDFIPGIKKLIIDSLPNLLSMIDYLKGLRW